MVSTKETLPTVPTRTPRGETACIRPAPEVPLPGSLSSVERCENLTDMPLSRVVGAPFRRLPPTVRSALLHARGDYAPWEGGFDQQPPILMPGEEVGPPDFVGVGIQKAGTSWWFDLLVEHPGVYDRPGIPKERHFLTRYGIAPFGPDDVARYHGWFPRRPGTLAGEWTPDYLPYPWVAPLLATAAPDAKILVLVREPIDRFRSGLTFRRRMGAPPTSVTVADAVRQGFAARGIRQLLNFFPSDQILVLQYEQCRDDPAGQLATTFDFLGLDPFEPNELRREVNVSGGGKVDLDADTEARLVALYRDDVADLVRLAPSFDLSLWPRFADVARGHQDESGVGAS